MQWKAEGRLRGFVRRVALAGSSRMQTDRKLWASGGRGVALGRVAEGFTAIYAAALPTALTFADCPNGVLVHQPTLL